MLIIIICHYLSLNATQIAKNFTYIQMSLFAFICH